MNAFDYFVYFVLLIKVLYFSCAIGIMYFTHTNNKKELDEFNYWKNRFEFIFKILMSIILILLFNPFRKTPIIINHHTRLLLFVYGIIVLLNVNWGLFFTESPLFRILKSE